MAPCCLGSCIFSTANQCICAQSCLTVCDPMDCSPSGSSVHGIFQARRILEWVAISFSRDLPDPGIEPASPESSALAGGFFTPEPPGKPCIVLEQQKRRNLIFSFVSLRSCTVPGLWNTCRKNVCGLNSEWMNSSQIWLNTYVLMPYICTFIRFFKVFPHISFPWCDY